MMGGGDGDGDTEEPECYAYSEVGAFELSLETLAV